MRKILNLLMLFLATSFGWQANAQNGGDTCADAVAVTTGIYNVDGIGPNGSATNPDATGAIWYSYTPSAYGTIDINSCATSTDTRVYIYDGDCADLFQLAFNDDDCGFLALGSGVSSLVSSGVTYTIEWDDRWSSNAFTWQLAFTPAPLDPNVLPITLENQLPAFGDFNGSFTQAIANPDATGANTSATVAENTVPANAAFAGVNFAVDTNIDISAQKGFTMSVWSPVANTPVLLKLENATTGVNAERAATTTTTGAWETISFDFSTEGDLTFESVTIFMNFNVQDPATQTYYWDNLVQTTIALDCNPVTGITISDITETSAVVSWNDEATALDGYVVGVFLPGSDPTVDEPVYAGEILPAGNLMDTATGLSSNTMYEAFVGSLCDEDGNIFVISDGVAFTTIELGCNPVTGITISDITETSAVVSWNDEATALDGYGLGVFLPGSDPTVDEPVYGGEILPAGTLMDIATGLSSNTMYEAVVVSLCSFDQELYVFSEKVAFTTIELGLADATIEGFTFYPNPSSDVINLTATENIETIAIYNLLGQKVIDQNINATSSQLDVTNLVTGTYFMEVSADGKTAWHKVIKK